MKIRNGFVSNSSSSSFLVLIVKDEYDSIINTVNPLTQAVVEQLSNSASFLGTECVAYNHMSGGSYCDFEWLSETECRKRAEEISKETGREYNEDDLEFWQSVEEFEEKIDQKSDKVFTNSLDF